MSEEKKVKKAPAKKATTAKKTTTTKATAKKTATKTAAKKPATAAKKTATKAATKTAAKKTTTKAATKTTAKKTAAKTTTKKAATKTTAKKTAAKTTKKTTTKKAPAKRTTRAKKVEEVVVDDAKLIKDLEMENTIANPEPVATPVEDPVEVPVASTSTNEFGTTTVSAEVTQAYMQQPVQQPVVETRTETVSQEEKKARKGGRKVIVTMVVVIILAIAAFLGLWYFSKITAHNKIVDTLDKLKAGDRDTAVELIDVSNTLGLDQQATTNNTTEDLLIVNQETQTTETTETTSVTNEIIQQSKKEEKDYIDFFKGMEYEIVEEKADFVDGYVKVRIVNKNIGKIIKKYYVRAFALSIQSAFSTQQSSSVQKRLDDYLKELLTSDEIERVSTEVTFKLKRDGFEWKLDVNKEELCDAILPGLREQLKDFEF